MISQQCSESGIWHTYEKCPFACNETTGKCYDPNDPTDPDRPLDTPAEVCRSIYDCYRQCLDDECVHACIELGTETPEGLNLFTAMLSCAANNCGGMTTAEDMNDCFLSYCKKEIEECNLAGSSDLIDPADPEVGHIIEKLRQEEIESSSGMGIDFGIGSPNVGVMGGVEVL